MTNSVLTVADLVATKSLDTRVLAGEDGLGREVLWAHSCEMADPARWLGPHELLMTVGLCVPVDAEEQVRFVARLDDAGLAGMMIGDHEPAPALSQAMFSEADRRDFPVLLAGPLTPYAVVARHVAAANATSQTIQVLTLSKLYHLAASAGEDSAKLVRDLGSLLRVGLRLLDPMSGLPLIATPIGGSVSSVDAARTQTHEYPLRGAHPVRLEVIEFSGEAIDSFVLVHLMKVLEVLADRILNESDRRAEISGRLMISLLNGMGVPEVAAFIAPELASDGFRLAAFAPHDGEALSRAVATARLPIVSGAGRTCHLALVPLAAGAEFKSIATAVGATVGLSSVFTDFLDARSAADEAARVLVAASHTTDRWAEFEGTTVSVLARSRHEASEIIEGVLGPLAGQDHRETSLRETLFAFLRNDRRWTETSTELGIHRQTLAYRLRRIEEATGLNLGRSADLSALWIAYQAWESTSGWGTAQPSKNAAAPRA